MEVDPEAVWLEPIPIELPIPEIQPDQQSIVRAWQCFRSIVLELEEDPAMVTRQQFDGICGDALWASRALEVVRADGRVGDWIADMLNVRAPDFMEQVNTVIQELRGGPSLNAGISLATAQDAKLAQAALDDGEFHAACSGSQQAPLDEGFDNWRHAVVARIRQWSNQKLPFKGYPGGDPCKIVSRLRRTLKSDSHMCQLIDAAADRAHGVEPWLRACVADDGDGLKGQDFQGMCAAIVLTLQIDERESLHDHMHEVLSHVNVKSMIAQAVLLYSPQEAAASGLEFIRHSMQSSSAGLRQQLAAVVYSLGLASPSADSGPVESPPTKRSRLGERGERGGHHEHQWSDFEVQSLRRPSPHRLPMSMAWRPSTSAGRQPSAQRQAHVDGPAPIDMLMSTAWRPSTMTWLKRSRSSRSWG